MTTSPHLFVVSVDESLNPTLTLRQPAQYTSPPQELPQAAALVQLLSAHTCDGPGPWRVPIAGGTRTITMEPCDTAAA